jgi:pimeloyl-ACP methyl ester carboxylesterase
VTWVILILIGIVVAFPFVWEARRKPIGEVERHGAPGGFAVLPQGITYYQWLGPVRGPIAVAIHDTTMPSAVWDEIAEGLGAISYRVLVYDLYGRGLSDAPKGAQDRAFHIRQLTDLLADQGLGQDLTLIGYGLGGAIATAFTADHPERVKRLILLAPMGLELKDVGLPRFIRQTPLIGDWLFMTLFGGQLRQTVAATPSRIGPAQLEELGRKGFLPAVLSSIRGIGQDRQEADHRAIGRADVPVVALWGQVDTVVPLASLGTLAQWNRNARQEVIAGAGHGLPYTHAAEVIAVLKDVLREV